jgi:hypothetical protein
MIVYSGNMGVNCIYPGQAISCAKLRIPKNTPRDDRRDNHLEQAWVTSREKHYISVKSFLGSQFRLAYMQHKDDIDKHRFPLVDGLRGLM